MTYGEIILSKTGKKIPLFSDGKPSASRYDPEKEAENFASSACPSALFVVSGLCGGFHISALKKRFPESMIIVVENTRKDFDFLFENLDECAALERKHGIFFFTVDGIKAALLEKYIPAMHRSLSFVEYRPWKNENEAQVQKIRTSIREALDEIAVDFSTQSRFGKIWQHNILKNLSGLDRHAEEKMKAEKDGTPCSKRIPSVASLSKSDLQKTAVVVAAGPSLDSKISLLKERRREFYIIATDTACQTLFKNGIFCDAVASLDGQFVSHGHFSGNIDPRTLFIFDLCANPFSARRILKCGAKAVFSRSAHPLASYAESTQEEPSFPILDSGSGTVTIFALDFARKSGFSKIIAVGADFSYIGGKAYARGTYLDGIFLQASRKNSSFEENFSRLFFRSPFIDAARPENSSTRRNSFRTTEILNSYRKSFTDYLEEHSLSCTHTDDVYEIANKDARQTLFFKTGFDLELFHTRLKKEILSVQKKLSENEGRELSLAEKDELFENPIVRAVLPHAAFSMRNPGVSFADALKLAFEDITRYTL